MNFVALESLILHAKFQGLRTYGSEQKIFKSFNHICAWLPPWAGDLDHLYKDIGSRGQGFEPHSGRHVVSLSKTYLPPQKYW